MELTDAIAISAACTLPTAERPLRIAEFNQLFAQAVAPVERPTRQAARVSLPARPEVAAQAADLAVRETECCSFFTFALTATGGRLHLDVTVPANQTPVLDALVSRIEQGATA